MDDVTKQCVGLFLAFFSRIDRSVSVRMLRRVPAFETTLTDELLALLDGEALTREHGGLASAMRRRINRLAASVPQEEDGLELPKWDLDMRAFDHGRGFEGRVSKADFGLLIEFGAKGHANYRRCIYLFQAKRLAPFTSRVRSSRFGHDSQFNSVSEHQHHRMLQIEADLKLDLYRYLYYMPPRLSVDPEWTKSAADGTRCTRVEGGGLWAGRVLEAPDVDPRWIYGAYLSETLPLAALLAAHVAEAIGEVGCAAALGGNALAHSLGSADLPPTEDLALALVSGDMQAVGAICAQLGLTPSGYPLVPNTVLKIRLPSPPEPRLVPVPSYGGAI
ncbi:hypothetical protein [Methylobacterium sp. D54C]